MKLTLVLIIVSTLGLQSVPLLKAQEQKKPKLVVGIVIDQMRAEYLYRFQGNYTEKGFKRLIKEGYNIKNVHYNYMPTYTGPGHASIYTGTTPSNHGIVANNWYSKKLKKHLYCAEDSEVKLTTSQQSKSNNTTQGQRSPKNLYTTTITDELKLFTNKRAKVIGISLKDRGAILPAGHLADYALWLGEEGRFITSTYYLQSLPDWLVDFNKSKRVDNYLKQKWNTLLPISNYVNSGPDDAPFEKQYDGKSTFPHDIHAMYKKSKNKKIIYETPFGNSILTDLAIETIENEKLGMDDITDFLAISYSSTDVIGHGFGIRSKEIEDTYVRLDRELARLLETLDKKVGKDNYTLFLTADHAAVDNPDFLKNNKLPGRFYEPKKIKKELNIYLSNNFGDDDYIADVDGFQVYLNPIDDKKRKAILESIRGFLLEQEGIKKVFVPEISNFYSDGQNVKGFFNNGYHLSESGDILFQFQPSWMPKLKYGTSHGSVYNADTHVPLLWYGWKIPKGKVSVKPHSITQIAPTLSFLLDIPLASASNHNPIEELFFKN